MTGTAHTQVGAGRPAQAGDGYALQAQALSVVLGSARQRRPVLHGVDLRIAAGRWTAVVGPNGAGKSTLLRALAGLQPHQGAVRLQGRLLAQWPPRERARQLAWLGQNESAAEDLTVYDVAMLGRIPHRAWLAPPQPADHAAVERALRSTHAWDWRERLLGRLSGGERQRVLLARALAVEAEVLLMDEPLANLDPPHQADWLALVRTLVAHGRTIVSVLHEITFALQAQELAIVDHGRVVHHGACADPATHKALAGVFGQRVQVRTIDGLRVALPAIDRNS